MIFLFPSPASNLSLLGDNPELYYSSYDCCHVYNVTKLLILQGNPIWKTVFVAFFQGEQLKSRVKKVCSGFHASFYPCPSTFAERQDMVKGVKARLEDLNLVSLEEIFTKMFCHIFNFKNICFQSILQINL